MKKEQIFAHNYRFFIYVMVSSSIFGGSGMQVSQGLPEVVFLGWSHFNFRDLDG